MAKRARDPKKKESKQQPAKKRAKPIPAISNVTYPPIGLAPEDPLPFDYDATKPSDEEMEAWARPPISKTILEDIEIKRDFTFQLVSCESSYVRPYECRARSMIRWPGTNQVPVVRLYGSTLEGQSVCVNVWNFAPYFFVHVPVDVERNPSLLDTDELEELTNELDKLTTEAKNQRYKQYQQDDEHHEEGAVTSEGFGDFFASRTPHVEKSAFQSPLASFHQPLFSDNTMDPFETERVAKDRQCRPTDLRQSSSLLASHSNDGLMPYDKVGSHRNHSSSSNQDFANGKAKVVDSRKFIVSLEKVNYIIGKDYIDEESLFLRVNIRTPNLVTALRNLVGHRKEGGLETSLGLIRGPTYESGVKFETRFMLDHKMVGSGLVSVKGAAFRRRPADNQDSECQIEIDADTTEVMGVSVDDFPERYLFKSRLRVHSRDLEVLSYTGDFPIAVRDPIINIYSEIYEVDALDKPVVSVGFVLGSLPPNNTHSHVDRFICFETETELLEAYGDFVRLVDPDIETGYNTKNFDAPYLVDRCKHLGLQHYMFSTRCKGREIQKREKMRLSKGMGNRKNWLCPSEGRVEIDMFQFISDNHKLSSYSLNAVSAHFLNDQKDDVSHKTIPILFRGSREDRLRLIRYCKKDTLLPIRLMVRLRTLGFLFEMCRAQGVQVADQQDGTSTLKVFTQILTDARANHTIIPYVPNQNKEWYPGANVFPPRKGFYRKPIVILDFFSLYPSEAIAHNVCFSTFVPNDTIEEVAARIGGKDKMETCPDGNTYVRSNIKVGIIPRVQKRLIERRNAAKAGMAAAKDPVVKESYSLRELALKITNNSVYGAQGIPNNGQYNQHVARSITAYGREQILKTRDVIEAHFTLANGFPGDAKVLYGDTDSVMVDFGLDTPNRDSQDEHIYIISKAKELAQQAADLCTRHFAPPNKLQVEGVFFPFLLITKKRYGGLLWPSGYGWSAPKIKGLECVRRDNCKHASRTQQQCLDILLKKLDPDEAIEHARRAIVKLRKNEVDFYDLIITASLSKTSEDYATPQAHAHVADLIKKRSPGSEPHIGDRVPYVIVAADKKSKRFERAEDPLFAIENELNIDTDYYVEKQMMGPLQRIFEPIFGEAETKRRLTSGETNTRIFHIDKKKSGLMLYFEKSANCMACGTTLLDHRQANGLCHTCEPKRLDFAQQSIEDVRKAQQEYSRVWTHCQTCQGTTMREVRCDATDCPLFYKRYTVTRDLEKTQERLKLLSLNDW